MRRPHPRHLREFSYIGCHRYTLRFSTLERRRVFVADAPVALVRQQLVRSAREQSFAVSAYVFMPEHIHLLVEGETESADCRKFIARFKQYSGYGFSKEYGARLWQRYGFERLLRNTESSAAAARYILENPVKAGLTKTIEEYPYTLGHRFMTCLN